VSAAHDPVTVLDRAVAALGGEDRAGQRQLVEAVAAAVNGRHHLLAEAPTGSGKGLAYLAALLASGRRAVVSTATLALQDQLWRKDLPHLREHGGIEFSTALLKGRSNYLCLAKLDSANGGDALFDERPSAGFRGDLERLTRFALESESGDVAGVDEAITPASWRLVTCGPNECPGAARCEHGVECFAEQARIRAEDVDLVVVNHALYCAHLATGGRLLPRHDVVVFDEAHALDRIATGALGVEVSPPGIRQLAGRLRNTDAPEATVDAMHDSARALEGLLDDLDGRVDPTDDPIAPVLDSLAERLAAAAQDAAGDDTDAIGTRAARLASSRLAAVRRMRAPEDTEVVWVDGAERRSLQLAPIAVGPRLAPLLFERVPSVLVSATLGPGERFEPLARRLGLDPRGDTGPLGSVEDDAPEDGDLDGDATPPRLATGYVSLRVETMFDYRSQSMLYVPRTLPEPRDPGWQDAAANELCELVTAAGGRALVLCTSWRAVDAYVEVLRARTDHAVLAQGEEPPPRLVEQFNADETSCLVATRAFWMGLDVPGPSCVLVVIDRLPFTRPDEPLEQARREAAELAGGDGFRDVDLPAAALVLAQGAGRLLRRMDDHGVVAVLDRRLATARYRDVLLGALPPMRRVVDRETVCDFLAGLTATTVTSP